MSNCEYCGTKIFENDRNCVKCGAPIANSNNKIDKFVPFLKITKTSVTGGQGNNLLYTYHHEPDISLNSGEYKLLQSYLEKLDPNSSQYKKIQSYLQGLDIETGDF